MLHQFSFNERQGLNPVGLAKVKWQGPLTDRDTFLTKFMHKDGKESYRGWIIAETLEEAQKILPKITNDMYTYEKEVYLGSGRYEKRRFLDPNKEVIILGKIDLSVLDKPAKYRKPKYQEPEPESMHGDEIMLQEDEWERRMSQPGGYWATEDELEDLEASSPLGRDFDASGYTDYPTQEDLREYGCVSNQEN